MRKFFTAVLLAALLLMLLSVPALAKTAGYTTDINGVVTYKTATDTYTATYKATDDTYYLMVVTKGTAESFTLTVNSVLYIDQQTGAKGQDMKFDFIPSEVPSEGGTVWLISKDGKTRLGTLLYRDPAAADSVSGTVWSWDDENNIEFRLYDAETEYLDILEDWQNTNADNTTALEVFTSDQSIEESDDGYAQDFSFNVSKGDYKLAICKAGKYIPTVIDIEVGGAYEFENVIALSLFGDVDGDGWTDATDASEILAYDVGNTIFDTAMELIGDVDCDEWTDATDASEILAYDVGNASVLKDLK